jgi:hypothetical protein
MGNAPAEKLLLAGLEAPAIAHDERASERPSRNL